MLYATLQCECNSALLLKIYIWMSIVLFVVHMSKLGNTNDICISKRTWFEMAGRNRHQQREGLKTCIY